MIVNRDAYPFFSALASETRLHIIELLTTRQMNITEIANTLGMSATVIARHISIMEKAEIVRGTNVAGKHGIQKVCTLMHNGLALNFKKKRDSNNMSVFSIPVGQYSSCHVEPTCGLCTLKSTIGFYDDPRYFSDPQHIDAKLLWVGHGYLEYCLPNYTNNPHLISEIRVQLEICSEAPGYDHFWPSDIYFHFNGKSIGFWTCPGDYGDKPGLYQPEWYDIKNSTQFGQLKTIKVTRHGSFIDGEQVSNITIDDLNIEYGESIYFRIDSPANCKNPRGFNLFGKGFGNYNQDIIITITTDEEEHPPA